MVSGCGPIAADNAAAGTSEPVGQSEAERNVADFKRALTACDPKQAQNLVGQELTDDLEAEAVKLTNAQQARVIAPGDMVTKDYLTGRLNIMIDERDIITEFRCG